MFLVLSILCFGLLLALVVFLCANALAAWSIWLSLALIVVAVVIAVAGKFGKQKWQKSLFVFGFSALSLIAAVLTMRDYDGNHVSVPVKTAIEISREAESVDLFRWDDKQQGISSLDSSFNYPDLCRKWKQHQSVISAFDFLKTRIKKIESREKKMIVRSLEQQLETNSRPNIVSSIKNAYEVTPLYDQILPQLNLVEREMDVLERMRDFCKKNDELLKKNEFSRAFSEAKKFQDAESKNAFHVATTNKMKNMVDRYAFWSTYSDKISTENISQHDQPVTDRIDNKLNQ